MPVPDGVPRPFDERWPGTEAAAAGPLHLDVEGLRRALIPLMSTLDELDGAGRGGLRDFTARAGQAGATPAWGPWLTADRQHEFHGRLVEEYAVAYGQLLDQLARIIEVVNMNVHATTGADAEAGKAFADIRANADAIVVPDVRSTPVAPVADDGTFD
ncbi:MAG TPA: hypothetical protein VLJ59_02380 [Mycobacteriales bacterium]|nr:hypothetical protein [Mycobacteriales bacterium]